MTKETRAYWAVHTLEKRMIRTVMMIFVCIILFGIEANANIQHGNENFFEMSLNDLQKVQVISASQKMEDAFTAPSSIIAITEQQIQERGYQSIEDLLKDVPGMDIVNVFGVFPTIKTFRGSYGDENKRLLLMIDGIVENQIIGGFELGGPIYSLHDVQRVELIYGPASALYGTNAYSGIINIITKHGKKENALSYQKSQGSFNTSTDNIAAYFTKDNVSMSVRGSLINSDGPKFSNRHHEFDDAYIDNAYLLLSKISYETENQKSTFGVNVSSSPAGDGTFAVVPTKILGGSSAGNMNQGNTGYLAHSVNNGHASRWAPYSNMIFLENEYKTQANLRLKSRVLFRKSGLDESTSSHFMRKDTVFRKSHRTHTSYLGSLTSRLEYDVNDKHCFMGGFEYKYNDIEKGYRGVNYDSTIHQIDGLKLTNLNATFKERENTIQNHIALFSQYVLKTSLLNSTSFIIGIRHDYNSIYGNSTNPRFGIVVHPWEKTSLKVLYGTAFRAPTNFELYREVVPIRIANPNLKPEKIKSLELGLSQGFDGILLSSNLFYNSMSNLITNSKISNIGETLKNVGKAYTYGFEIYANIAVAEHLESFANFTYTHAAQNDGHGYYNIQNVAKFKGNIGITGRIPQFLSATLIGNWLGARSVARSNPLGQIDPCFQVRLSITTAQFIDNKVSISFAVNNLFDVTSYDPGIRDADGRGIYGTVHEQPGINGLVTLRVDL